MAAEALGGSRWIFHNLRGILCGATFEKKWHFEMKWRYDVEVEWPTDFSPMSWFQPCNCHWLEWRHYGVIYISKKMTKSDLWHCLLTFQRSSKVIVLDRPFTFLKCLNCLSLDLRPNMQLFFHMSLSITPLYRSRCQSGQLPQFANCPFYFFPVRVTSFLGC